MEMPFFSTALERLRLLVAEKERTIQALIDQKDQAALNFTSQLAERERAIQALADQNEQAIQSLKSQLTEKDALIREKEQAAQQLQLSLTRRDQAIQKLEARLKQIQSSNGWRALQYYYVLRDKLLPPGSGRRKAIKFLWRVATRQPVAMSKPKAVSQLNITHLSVPTLVESGHEENLPLIDKKVSAVIPVKNAGSNFQHLLRKLKAQKGLRECEIIVVDSGSTDGTLQMAKNEGAVVVEIPPESFNHAFSRNKGAERATGDYILFTVQDALPLTDRWLWEMAKTLEQNSLAAVSCAEYPRSDCDLFYRSNIWNGYRTLNLDKDRILAWDESCSSYMGLRSNAQIYDVAALIRRDIFDQYKFRAKYAEDLDLGIRLIKDKHRIGFLSSVRVLHSHNRTPYYFLKRAYVDTKSLNERFPDFDFPPTDNQAKIFQDIAALYFRTNRVVSALADLKDEQRVEGLMPWIRDMYSRNQGTLQESDGRINDNDLAGFVQSLVAQSGTRLTSWNGIDNLILPHFLHQFGLLETYVGQTYQIADKTLVGELESALYKLMALQSGAHLAYLYITLSGRQSSEQFSPDFDGELSTGI